MRFKNNTIYSVEDFRRLYEHYSCGHWFSKDTMRFFKTKILEGQQKIIGDSIYFITSEVNPSEVKAFTIRRGYIDGDSLSVETVGDFHSIPTRHRAISALKAIDK